MNQTSCQSSANNQFQICPLNEKHGHKPTFHFLSKWAERFSKRSACFAWPQLKSCTLLSWGRYYKSQTKFARSFFKYFSSSETIKTKCFKFSSKNYLGRNCSVDSAKASGVALGNPTQHVWMKTSFDRRISPHQRLFSLHYAADLPLSGKSPSICEKKKHRQYLHYLLFLRNYYLSLVWLMFMI